jgi:hypothetical protein
MLSSLGRNSAVIASAFDVLTSPQVLARVVLFVMRTRFFCRAEAQSLTRCKLLLQAIQVPCFDLMPWCEHAHSFSSSFFFQRGAATQTHPCPLLAQIVADLQVGTIVVSIFWFLFLFCFWLIEILSFHSPFALSLLPRCRTRNPLRLLMCSKHLAPPLCCASNRIPIVSQRLLVSASFHFVPLTISSCTLTYTRLCTLA